jgi:hypothetical protein
MAGSEADCVAKRLLNLSPTRALNQRLAWPQDSSGPQCTYARDLLEFAQLFHGVESRYAAWLEYFEKLAITLATIGVATVTSFKLIVCALLFCAVSASGADAQIMIDVNRITCDEFLHDTITVPDNLAYWLAGYYDARIGNTEFDVGVLKHNVSKLEDYCQSHRDVTVMTAVETLIGLGK